MVSRGGPDVDPPPPPHCLGFRAVTNTPTTMATTVKPWAKIRPLISSWDCLVLPWWKARSPHVRAPAVPKHPGRGRDNQRMLRSGLSPTQTTQPRSETQMPQEDRLCLVPFWPFIPPGSQVLMDNLAPWRRLCNWPMGTKGFSLVLRMNFCWNVSSLTLGSGLKPSITGGRSKSKGTGPESEVSPLGWGAVCAEGAAMLEVKRESMTAGTNTSGYAMIPNFTIKVPACPGWGSQVFWLGK